MLIKYVYDLNENKFVNDDSITLSIKNFRTPMYYDYIEFHEYHKKFADEVFQIIVKSNNKFIGYCYLGAKDGVLKAPYSSPFSLIHLKENLRITDACAFVDCIKAFALEKDFNKVVFTLPPDIYDSQLINILITTFFSQGFKVKSIEHNNQFDFQHYESIEAYLKKSAHKVRQNYKKAIKNELKFEQIDISDFKKAYEVIRINRNEMGYPLKISYSQMKDIINMNCIKIRAFVVNKVDEPVAAAIVFDITDEVSQVIYWGDIPEYRNERAMDLLTIEIFNFYNELGKKYLDIGPSSEDGIINPGLAEFKKSIGCGVATKLLFEYDTI